MKVVTVRDFRDHATEMFRSEDVILVTREGELRVRDRLEWSEVRAVEVMESLR